MCYDFMLYYVIIWDFVHCYAKTLSSNVIIFTLIKRFLHYFIDENNYRIDKPSQ